MAPMLPSKECHGILHSLPDILLAACAVIELLPSNQQEEIEETDV